MKRMVGILLVLLSGALAGTGGPLFAAVINVPGDYPTIQEAMDAAADGDEVEVEPGTYYEHVVWPSTDNLTLRSTEGREVTVVDGSGNGTVLEILSSGAQLHATVEGLTLTNAGDHYVNYIAGLSATHVTFQDCTISRCNGAFSGIGCLTLGGGTLVVTDCELRENTGGGVKTASLGLTTRVTGCTVTENGDGLFDPDSSGGLVLLGGHVEVRDNAIIGNHGFGLVATSILLAGGTVVIADNQIQYNTQTIRSGGILVALSEATTASITGNTVTANNALPDPLTPEEPTYSTGIIVMQAPNVLVGQAAPERSTGPGGVRFEALGTVTISRNTVSAHTGTSAVGLLVAGGTPTIDRNTVYGNVGEDPFEVVPEAPDLTVASSGLALADWPEIPPYDPFPIGATITNNLVYDNGTHGVYTCLADGGSATLTNNTITGNTQTGVEDCVPESSTIVNSILWNNNDDLLNASATYSDIEDGDAGEGNISEDPIFVAASDLHLQETSPCVDAGSNAAPGIPARDMDDQIRIQDGDGNGTATVDMGADELPAGAPAWGAADTAGGSWRKRSGSAAGSPCAPWAPVLLLPVAFVTVLRQRRRRAPEA